MSEDWGEVFNEYSDVIDVSTATAEAETVNEWLNAKPRNSTEIIEEVLTVGGFRDLELPKSERLFLSLIHI